MTPAPKVPFAPAVVGAARGVLAAAALAAIGAVIVALGGVHTGTLAPFVPVAVLVLRSVEGMIDQKKAKVS